tara:strand:- start:653 stop:859 length:207 start_codon:yes stop_codon:yes gene_type:complete
MSNHYNDEIIESLVEEILEETPDISDEDLKQEVENRFDLLPDGSDLNDMDIDIEDFLYEYERDKKEVM